MTVSDWQALEAWGRAEEGNRGREELVSNDGWPTDEPEEQDLLAAGPDALDAEPTEPEVVWLVPGIIAADDGVADEWLND